MNGHKNKEQHPLLLFRALLTLMIPLTLLLISAYISPVVFEISTQLEKQRS